MYAVFFEAMLDNFWYFLAYSVQLDGKRSEKPDDDPQCTAAKKIMTAVKLAGVSNDENRMYCNFRLKLKKKKKPFTLWDERVVAGGVK